MKKLTLNADPQVIEMAKRMAAESETSVSSIFERFIRLLARKHRPKQGIGPAARAASGVIRLPKGKGELDVLAEALGEKYGTKRCVATFRATSDSGPAAIAEGTLRWEETLRTPPQGDAAGDLKTKTDTQADSPGGG